MRIPTDFYDVALASKYTDDIMNMMTMKTMVTMMTMKTIKNEKTLMTMMIVMTMTTMKTSTTMTIMMTMTTRMTKIAMRIFLFTFLQIFTFLFLSEDSLRRSSAAGDAQTLTKWSLNRQTLNVDKLLQKYFPFQECIFSP